MKSFHTNKFISLILFNLLFFQNQFFSNKLIAQENKNIPTSEYIRSFPKENYYILGPGDGLKIVVSEEEAAQELITTAFIDGEGTIDLKRLNKIYVEGLTVTELQNILNKEYSYYINNPDVKISIGNYKKIKVLLQGEVQDQGIHVLDGATNDFEDLDGATNDFENVDNSISSVKKNQEVYFPTIVDAIKKGGGVTYNSDLTKVTVIRKNSLSNGGGRIKAEFNLLKDLTFEESGQNIRVFDGDTIIISKSEVPILKQIKQVNQANLQPKFIQVFIGGRVENKGFLKINRSASLVEAIVMNGGTRILKGPIQFLRYDNDGTIDQRKFNFKKSAKKGSYKNPVLQNGDYIVIGKSKFNIATEVINEITSPFAGLAASIRVYEFFYD